jgi:hypothetical protein
LAEPAERKSDVTILLDTSAQKVQKKTLQQSMVTKFESSFSLVQLRQVRRCTARSRFIRMQGTRELKLSLSARQKQKRNAHSYKRSIVKDVI